MGLVATGIPAQLETKMVSTPDGDFERVYFRLDHPLASEDKFPDLFRVGSKFAEVIRDAAAAGQVVSVFTTFKRKEEGKGGAKDVWYYQVDGVEA